MTKEERIDSTHTQIKLVKTILGSLTRVLDTLEEDLLAISKDIKEYKEESRVKSEEPVSMKDSFGTHSLSGKIPFLDLTTEHNPFEWELKGIGMKRDPNKYSELKFEPPDPGDLLRKLLQKSMKGEGMMSTDDNDVRRKIKLVPVSKVVSTLGSNEWDRITKDGGR